MCSAARRLLFAGAVGGVATKLADWRAVAHSGSWGSSAVAIAVMHAPFVHGCAGSIGLEVPTFRFVGDGVAPEWRGLAAPSGSRTAALPPSHELHGPQLDHCPISFFGVGAGVGFGVGLEVPHTRLLVFVGATISNVPPLHKVIGAHVRSLSAVRGDVSYSDASHSTLSRHCVSRVSVGAQRRAASYHRVWGRSQGASRPRATLSRLRWQHCSPRRSLP